jgi:S1-C subfamily serine protease
MLLAPQRLAWCEPEPNKAYIGLSLRSLMDSPGMMVLLVNTESPAWHAEMKVGDILLEVDGRLINRIGDL